MTRGQNQRRVAYSQQTTAMGEGRVSACSPSAEIGDASG